MRFLIYSILYLLILSALPAQQSSNSLVEDGEVASSYQSGSLYLSGQNGNVNYTKSHIEFQKGIQADYAPSYYALGYMYFKGLGVEQDYNKAVDYFEYAAIEGIAEADMMLGSCYYHGVGKKENISSALFHLRKASIAGSSQAYAIYKKIEELGSVSYSEIFRRNLNSPIHPTFIPNQYEKLESNQSFNNLEGQWEGLWVTYDWSGSKIMDKATIRLSVKVVDENAYYSVNFIEGDLDLYENDTYSIVNTGGTTTGSFEKRAFSGEIQRWEVNQLRSHSIEEDGGITFSQINIKSNSLSTKEPSPPTSIFLVPSESVEHVKTNIEIFPNPSSDFFTIQIKLLKDISASVAIYSLNGNKILEIEKEHFDSGVVQRHITWPDQVADGIYVVKVQGDKFDQSSFIIKRR